jgi:hypothetical protein
MTAAWTPNLQAPMNRGKTGFLQACGSGVPGAMGPILVQLPGAPIIWLAPARFSSSPERHLGRANGRRVRNERGRQSQWNGDDRLDALG